MEQFLPFTDLLNEDENDVPLDYLGTPSEALDSHTLESTQSLKSNQKHKGKNFSVDEDQLLVSAWLNISTDARQELSQNSLLHRWMTIQKDVSMFCGYLSQIEAANQSGLNIHDKVEQAQKMFKPLDKHKKSFLFRHSWCQLRNQPKWHEKLQQLAALKTSNKKTKRGYG